MENRHTANLGKLYVTAFPRSQVASRCTYCVTIFNEYSILSRFYFGYDVT